MRRLDLDFQRRPGPSPLAWGVLALSLVTLGGLVWSHDQLRREVDSMRAATSQAQRSATSGNALASREPATAEMAAARAALEQIGLPWDDVFSALESAAHKDVALLAVNPDPRKRQLRLAAEARNLAAMLAFHQRLEKATHLRDVALTDHEMAADDPQHPVRFNIVATWVIAP